MRGYYNAEVGGPAGRVLCAFRTVGECREWATSFGTTADWCVIRDWKGRKVGEHRRVMHNANWYRVPWQPDWHLV